MVSAVARPYIDASVPVLREHGLTITRTFYSNMFAEHPELTNLFNMGNQASGVQQQSLASAVFAYAANIDNAAALGPVVSRIVHKHVSVGIKAEHYPIVGRHLLGAIKEVLGDAATPPLISAWDEAYCELALALISAEKEMYAQAGIEPGQLQNMRVIDICDESADIKAFVLEAMPGEAAPPFKPGQYVSVSVNFENGPTQLRQYSLSDAPTGRTLRISVKREQGSALNPAGQVSNWLHDNVVVGSVVRVTHPFGDFTPDAESTAPIVLLSAGVGITPMISVLNRISQVHPNRQVVFAHAARSTAHYAHRPDIARAQSVMPNLHVVNFLENLTSDDISTDYPGRMDISKLPKWPLDEANVYLCGPVEFMQEQWRSLIEMGVPPTRLHREVFGPELLNYLR
ncbi:flavohemoprotein [Massilia sp. WF1]|uniref:globin domain-containing protein n=1 Tax=unclassified Massilia TaxID=2609279 RepID=UPI00064973DB|nr:MULTISPECIES: globin domain-containing protein [unclassified Massilia]ALK96249.1 flavohemoprotein [Massilia sp. WG5]KLU36898.1 flavohemoprotein [Massilia sp. WF1]